MLATTTTRSVTVDVVGEQAPPAKPLNLALRPLGTSTVRATFDDRSGDEAGFRLEYSTSPDFSRDRNAVNVPADTPFVDVTGLQPSTQYFFRVRSFNTAGSSAFTGRPATVTLAPSEILIDPDAPGDGKVPGNAFFSAPGFTRVEDDRALFGDFLKGGATATFRPFVPASGDYFLFARTPVTTNVGVAEVLVASADEDEDDLRSFTYNQSRGQGGFVQLGTVSLAAGSRNTITINGTNLAIDALRLIPTA